MSTDDEVENPFPTQEQRVDKIKKVQIIKPGEIDEGKKKPLSVRVERFFDRHNHLMEFIRTVLALLVLSLQLYIISRL